MHRFSFRRLPRVAAVLLALLAILSLCACDEGGSLTSEVPRSVFGISPLERTPAVPDEAPATHAPAFTSGLFEPQQEDDFMPRELSIGELIFSDSPTLLYYVSGTAKDSKVYELILIDHGYAKRFETSYTLGECSRMGEKALIQECIARDEAAGTGAERPSDPAPTGNDEAAEIAVTLTGNATEMRVLTEQPVVYCIYTDATGNRTDHTVLHILSFDNDLKFAEFDIRYYIEGLTNKLRYTFVSTYSYQISMFPYWFEIYEDTFWVLSESGKTYKSSSCTDTSREQRGILIARTPEGIDQITLDLPSDANGSNILLDPSKDDISRSLGEGDFRSNFKEG